MNVTCTNCGWVHFLLDRSAALICIHDFNHYARTHPKEHAEFYNGRWASIAEYEKCFNCGGPGPMRASVPGDCPEGCTIQPTVLEPTK